MTFRFAIATPPTDTTTPPNEIGHGFSMGTLARAAARETAVCEMVAGRYSHTGQDVMGARNMNGRVEIAVRDGRCVITANGIPDHAFNNGSQPFRHDVSEQSYELSFPLRPTRASTPTALSMVTNNGRLLNGARIDMLAEACFGVGDEKTGCNDPNQPWRFDPVYQANGFRMDSHLAHTQPDGSYHYHGVGDLPNESMVIGFAYSATETFPYYVGCFVGTLDPSFNKQGGGGQAPGNEVRPEGERGQNGRPPRPQRPRHNGGPRPTR